MGGGGGCRAGSREHIYVYLLPVIYHTKSTKCKYINIHNMDSKGVSLGVLPLQS